MPKVSQLEAIPSLITSSDSIYIVQSGVSYKATFEDLETFVNAIIVSPTITAIDYTMVATDDIIKATAGLVTITLLTAVGRSGKRLTVDNSSISDIFVLTDGAETINKETRQIVPIDSAMAMYSDGSNWRIT